MPLFDFTCTPCGERREVLARSPDIAQPPRCPVCGRGMAREWSPVATVGRSTAGCAAPRGGFS